MIVPSIGRRREQEGVGRSAPAPKLRAGAGAVKGRRRPIPCYKQRMVRFLSRVATCVLAAFSGSAWASGPAADETITVSRTPWGICGSVCAEYDVTLWPDGRVVALTHGISADLPREELVDRFQVSPAEAARFRAALLPYRPAAAGPTPTICGGEVFTEDVPLILRIPLFEIRWSGPAFSAGLQACYHPREQAIVDAIDQALRAIHLRLDGRERPARPRASRIDDEGGRHGVVGDQPGAPGGH